MGSLPEKNIKITFWQTPHSLWNLDLKNIDICWLTCCAPKYLKLLSLITIQLVPKMFPLLLTVIVLQKRTTSASACLVWWYCHFVPNYMMKVKLINYWMPNNSAILCLSLWLLKAKKWFPNGKVMVWDNKMMSFRHYVERGRYTYINLICLGGIRNASTARAIVMKIQQI